MKKTLEYSEPMRAFNNAVNDQIDVMVLKIQKERIKKGISQYELAKRTGVAHTTIMRIEHYDVTPTMSALLKMAKALGMDMVLTNEEKAERVDNSITEQEKATEYTPKDSSSLIFEQVFQHKMLVTCSGATALNSEYYMSDIKKLLLKLENNLKTERKVNQRCLQKITQISNTLQVVLQEYVLGQHATAYDLFSEVMREMDIQTIYEPLKEKCLYRARKICGKNKNPFTYNSFFHIPFDKRFKVGSQRYSYPGLPCLYMGNTPEVCCNELNCTKNQVSIAEIDIVNGQEKLILDLTKPLRFLFDCNYGEKQNDDLLKWIPLVFMCSTEISKTKIANVGEEKIAFRIDYVIPQLLLEYVLDQTVWNEKQVLGIKYYSVREKAILDLIRGNTAVANSKINYAIPARTNSESGYCKELQKTFYVKKIMDDPV